MGRCEKIDLSLFPIIPAKAGIQCFQSLANFLDPGFHRGGDLNSIFSHLRGTKGDLIAFQKTKGVPVSDYQKSTGS
jgi:hypothetical protein